MIEVLHFTAELPVTSGQLSIEASKEEIKQIVLGKSAIKNQKQSLLMTIFGLLGPSRLKPKPNLAFLS